MGSGRLVLLWYTSDGSRISLWLPQGQGLQAEHEHFIRFPSQARSRATRRQGVAGPSRSKDAGQTDTWQNQAGNLMGPRIKQLMARLWDYLSGDFEQRKKCWEQFGEASGIMGGSGSWGPRTSESEAEREQTPGGQSHFFLSPVLLFDGVRVA